MFTAWGHFVYRFRWLVLFVSVLLLAGSGYIATQGGKLESGGFIETAESGRATKLLNSELPSATSFTVILSSDTLSASDARFKQAVNDVVAPLRNDSRVVQIITPYDGIVDPATLTSRSGHDVAVNVLLKDDLAIARDYYPELREKLRSDTLGIQVTGVPAINHGFNVILGRDLLRAETVSLPLAAILLLIVFGTVVAAFIPLGVGVLSVVTGVAGMFLLSHVQTVSVYAENVVTLIGLGVAIDYSLFVANRFREELHRGRSVDDATAIAIATSGRAITFLGYEATSAPASKYFLPNVTKSLCFCGATSEAQGWTTPIMLQSVTATSATLRWYRFSDGALMFTQTVALTPGSGMRIDPWSVSQLAAEQQYAVVVDAGTSTVTAMVVELAPGGDNAMGYTGFPAP